LRQGREAVHHVIYDELVVGKVLPESRAKFAKIIAGLRNAAAQGIILGCTEIGLLVPSGGQPRAPL
jgi:aspartate racemase